METSDQESNKSLQEDEIQALSSIYGEEWTVENEEQKTFGVNISDGSQSIFLQVTFPPTYPLQSPPVYQLSAPWMDRLRKRQLADELENIYCSNMGESIIYLWVEKAREFLKYTPVKEQVFHDGSEKQVISDYSAFNVELGNELPPITHGATIVDRRSVFQAHVATVVYEDQVKEVLSELKKNGKIASATHNILAYRIYQESNRKIYEDFDDDGETRAGSSLLHMLQVLGVRNVMVVVTRWYGGIHLGPDRFRHIKASAREALVTAGYIKDQVSSKKKEKTKRGI